MLRFRPLIGTLAAIAVLALPAATASAQGVTTGGLTGADVPQPIVVARTTANQNCFIETGISLGGFNAGVLFKTRRISEKVNHQKGGIAIRWLITRSLRIMSKNRLFFHPGESDHARLANWSVRVSRCWVGRAFGRRSVQREGGIRISDEKET